MTDQKDATGLQVLIARLHGRAMFLRKLGEVKSPELMESAAKALASQSSRIDTATDAALRAVDEELARRAVTSADRGGA